MRRLMRLLCLGTVLSVPALAMFSWLFYKGPVCVDIEREMLSRVKALMSMHILKNPPEIDLVQECGLRGIPDGLYFDFKSLLHVLSFSSRPLQLSWQDLRILQTKEILAHPFLGATRWIIRFDQDFDRPTRRRLVEIMRHYLQDAGRSPVIEQKILKVDTRASQGQQKDQFPLQPFGEVEGAAAASGEAQTSKGDRLLAWFIPAKSPMDKELFQQLVLYVSMLLLAVLLLKNAWRRLLLLLEVERKSLSKDQALAAKAAAAEQAAALFGPYFIATWRDRAGDILQSLLEHDSLEMLARIRSWLQQDREAVYWALLAGDANFRSTILQHMPAEELMMLGEFAKDAEQGKTQSEARALSRFILMLGRELSRNLHAEKIPLALQLLTTDEWRTLVSQLSRNRRRVLARRLGARRAIALEIKAYEWGASASAEESEERSCQKILSILEQKEADLRECLGPDAEVQACLSNFFGDLTKESADSRVLMLVWLAGAALQRRTFASSVLVGDQRVALALKQMDNEVAALTLFDCEKPTRERALSLVPERMEGILASLKVLELDRMQQKKWKMRSKAHQRFFERQVLIAELFT